MFRPSGLIKATVPNPVPGGAPLTDWWVADEASGFCRLDNTGIRWDTGPSNGILNLSTCYLPGTFAPVDYQVETNGLINNQGVPSNGYVFVAGIKEVTRLEFMASPTEPGRTIINAKSQISIFDSAKSRLHQWRAGEWPSLCARHSHGSGWQALYLLPGQRRYLAHQEPAYAQFHARRKRGRARGNLIQRQYASQPRLGWP